MSAASPADHHESSEQPGRISVKLSKPAIWCGGVALVLTLGLVGVGAIRASDGQWLALLFGLWFAASLCGKVFIADWIAQQRGDSDRKDREAMEDRLNEQLAELRIVVHALAEQVGRRNTEAKVDRERAEWLGFAKGYRQANGTDNGGSGELLHMPRRS